MRTLEMPREEEPTTPPQPEAESLSHSAEGLVVDFLGNGNFGFTNIERTSIRGRNDRDGIDAIGDLGDGIKLAIDITFNDGEKLKEKRQRNLRQPCVALHDENGKPISDPMPRILIKDISQRNWKEYEKEAKTHGIRLIDVMGAFNRRKKEKQFLIQILQQISGLSRISSDYAQRIKSAQKIFEQKLEELNK